MSDSQQFFHEKAIAHSVGGRNKHFKKWYSVTVFKCRYNSLPRIQSLCLKINEKTPQITRSWKLERRNNHIHLCQELGRTVGIHGKRDNWSYLQHRFDRYQIRETDLFVQAYKGFELFCQIHAYPVQNLSLISRLVDYSSFKTGADNYQLGVIGRSRGWWKGVIYKTGF